MNLEGSVSTRSQIQVQYGSIAFLGALEGLDSLGILYQSAKAEVLKAYDACVGDTCQVHRVIPYVVVILHPVVAVSAASHKTCDTCRIVGVWGQTINLESL